MKNVDIGTTGLSSLVADQRHTAASAGNPDVAAISTASLIVLFEGAAHNCLKDHFDEGEVSLGTSVNIRHIAAARPGTQVTATAVLTELDGTKANFEIEVRSQRGDLLMKGTHGRVVVSLEKFLQSLRCDRDD